MDAKEQAAVANAMVHIIRALDHNTQLGLMMALNQAVLSKHGPDCAVMVVEDMIGWINEMRSAVKVEPKALDAVPETDPLKIN